MSSSSPTLTPTPTATPPSRKRKATETPAEAAEEAVGESESCPYLDTIQRSLLDFDQAAACSVTLERGPHIYACLVCGKFFRGRGPHTAAYTHAVECAHYVFVHLHTAKFYCLPDNYEILDASSLRDIRDALQPRYTIEQVQQLDTQADLSRDLFGTKYVPGFVGLHNHGKTDALNAVIQALAHVSPLRNYFLVQQEVHSTTTGADTVAAASNTKPNKKEGMIQQQKRVAQQVTLAFGALVRRLWSEQRFKATVDPQQMVQAVMASSNQFKIGQQPEVGTLLAWLLHQLHLGTTTTTNKKDGHRKRKKSTSIIHQVFQGQVRVTTREAKAGDATNTSADKDDRLGSDDEDEEMAEPDNKNEDKKKQPSPAVEVEVTTAETNFLQLTLEIPEKPLFRDADGGLVIPQEPLVNVLKKFDGVTFMDAVNRRTGAAQRKSYQLLQLPDHLILHLSRFKQNGYTREKNPTIVVFPVKNFDWTPYLPSKRKTVPPPTEDEVRNMSVKEIKLLLKDYGQGQLFSQAVEKEELVNTAVDFVCKSLPDLLTEKYDLVANITHESPADVGREGKVDPLQEGSYKVHVQHPATKQWYEIQDLHVQEIMPQQIGLSESHVLIFRKTTGTKQKK